MLHLQQGALGARPAHMATRPCGTPSHAVLTRATRTAFGGQTVHSTCSTSRGSIPLRRLAVVVHARYNSSPDLPSRLLAIAPYLLPLLDSFSYGRFLFYQFPAIKALIRPLVPLVQLYTSVPFAALGVFFGIYIGIVNNQRLPRFVRFNAMQAVLLDILLVMPRLVESLVSPPGTGWGAQLYINSQNFIWLFVATCVALGAGAALLGKTARLPLVAEAADQQVR